MVTVLQLNRLELKDMIINEISENPVLEESGESGEELTPEEVQNMLERELRSEPADQAILDHSTHDSMPEPFEAGEGSADFVSEGASASAAAPAPEETSKSETDPFDEIDFGSYFDDYLDPGFKSPAGELVEKPSFETFLSSPVTLADHLQSQLAVLVLPERIRDAANAIVGNLEESGYLTTTLEEVADSEGLSIENVRAGLKAVQSLDPTGVGACTMRECLLLQLDARGSKGSVAWNIVHDHLKLLETRQYQQLAKVLCRPLAHIQIAVNAIRHLDPAPGLRYTRAEARPVEPDVYIEKDGDEYRITLNEDDIPQLRLNGNYKHLLDRNQEPSKDAKDARNYAKERYASALQFIKNIEQRKQTIFRVCHSLVRRQQEFLDHGITHLKPMMIKEVAEEIGVHPSTASRAVMNKYVHTPQGVFDLRKLFSEQTQGSSGVTTPLPVLKLKVKKMIEEEDSKHPLTDERITELLRSEGFDVNRRTIAKYREDMKIPSTHKRRDRDRA